MAVSGGSVGRAAVLDVGHGNSCVIEAGDGTAVIDTGKQDDLLLYLLERELFEVDHLILSHGDEDHIAAGYLLLTDARFLVRNVYYSAEQFRDTGVYRRVRRAAKDAEIRRGTNQASLSRGTIIPVGSARLEVLHPSHTDVSGARSTTDANSLSIIVRVSTDAGGVIFLAGDGDGVSLSEVGEFVRARRLDPTATYLVFPHHGSAVAGGRDVSGYVDSWMRLVQPETVIFSTQRYAIANRRKHPDPRVIQRIAASATGGARVMCTQLSAECHEEHIAEVPTHVSVQGNGVRRLAAGRCPCAGTTVIDLLSGRVVEPDESAHEQFKDGLQRPPMCRQGWAGPNEADGGEAGPGLTIGIG